MLNNKGQSLVLFIIVLPFLLLTLVLVIDIGRVVVLKQELDNINKIVLDYGLENLDNENLNNEIIELVELNNDGIRDININLVEDRLYVELNTCMDGLFSGLINISIFEVNSSYVGYTENDVKRIERVSRWWNEFFFRKNCYYIFS